MGLFGPITEPGQPGHKVVNNLLLCRAYGLSILPVVEQFGVDIGGAHIGESVGESVLSAEGDACHGGGEPYGLAVADGESGNAGGGGDGVHDVCFRCGECHRMATRATMAWNSRIT